MERKLHLLDSFEARGSDGQRYKVCAFEHLARDETLLSSGRIDWEPTGQTEYRLADGRAVEMRRDGAMRVWDSDIELEPIG